MRLNEARHDAAAIDVERLGAGTDVLCDVGTSADGDDPAVGDGERLGRGPRLVDGQYGPGDDQVCGGHVHGW